MFLCWPHYWLFCAWLLKKVTYKIWIFFKHKNTVYTTSLVYTSGRVATFPGHVETSNRMPLLNSISHAKFVSEFGFRLLFVLYNRNGKVNGFKHHTLKGTVTGSAQHLFHSIEVRYLDWPDDWWHCPLSTVRQLKRWSKVNEWLLEVMLRFARVSCCCSYSKFK